ncbi:MAG TPA: class I SAM-dependent methyltransferase [Thermoplasmata archaeon]|nr:class I SAM-dependent methyltransferase [Thermoplasmata archaeon]
MTGQFEPLVRAIGDDRTHPDLEWVQALTGATERRVEEAIGELNRHTALIEGIRARHREAGRPFYAQIPGPCELYALTRLSGATEIVETGVPSGVSSAFFLLGLAGNGSGRLHSIDMPTRSGTSPVRLPPGKSTGWAVPPELLARWDLNLGPSQALLPELVKELGHVDLFLHDSLHTPEHLAFELETIRPRLSAGSLVLADNNNWTGDAFPRFAASLGARVHARRNSYLVGLRVPKGRRSRPTRRR